jgi:antitoxin YxxD
MRTNDFSVFMQYIFTNPDADIWSNRHVFFPVDKDEITEAEKRLQRRLPIELRNFYCSVGYGFLCNGKSFNVNRIISPIEIADFYDGINDYVGDIRIEDNISKDQLIFFEVSAQAFITIDASRPNENQCTIFYNKKKIANSLMEFLEKMDKQVDYYTQIS